MVTPWPEPEIFLMAPVFSTWSTVHDITSKAMELLGGGV